MSVQAGYKRSFVIFNNEDSGYDYGQKASGHVRIEVRDLQGKLHASVQNLRNGNDRYKYFLCLLSNKAGKMTRVCAGEVIPELNKAELNWNFDPNNVGGTGLSINDFDIAAILVEHISGENGRVICPLAAYMTKKSEWRSRYAAAKSSGQFPEMLLLQENKKTLQKENDAAGKFHKDNYIQQGYAPQADKEAVIKEATTDNEGNKEKASAGGKVNSEAPEAIENDLYDTKENLMGATKQDNEGKSYEKNDIKIEELINYIEVKEETKGKKEAEKEGKEEKGEAEENKEVAKDKGKENLGAEKEYKEDNAGKKPDEKEVEKEGAKADKKEAEAAEKEVDAKKIEKEAKEKAEFEEKANELPDETGGFNKNVTGNENKCPETEDSTENKQVIDKLDTGCMYLNGNMCAAFVNKDGYPLNPCADCRLHHGNVKPAQGPAGNISWLKDELARAFEPSDPFRSRRSDYSWWKVTNPVNLNNMLYQSGIRSPLMFNPAVMMAHYKYRHLIIGIFTHRAREKQYVVCGVPGMYMVDRKPFGEMSRWVQVEGSKPRYGAFGYWLVYIDPEDGRILSLD